MANKVPKNYYGTDYAIVCLYELNSIIVKITQCERSPEAVYHAASLLVLLIPHRSFVILTQEVIKAINWGAGSWCIIIYE